MRILVGLVSCVLAVGACSSSAKAVGPSVSTTTAAKTTTPKATVSTTTAPARVTTPTVDPTKARPFSVIVPKSYTGTKRAPLVVLLHGYGATGAVQDAYFRMQPVAQQRGFLYVFLNGTKDPGGRRFWNATDACCNLYGAKVDDSAYVMAVIDKVQKSYKVDPKRIYLVGHSNGGFMDYRMACDHADKIAAIASLAGATFADTTQCKPAQPVSVLEIHGDADKTIKYPGGQIVGHAYPSAPVTVATWAKYDGCRSPSRSAPEKFDLVTNRPGSETSVSTFPGCPPGVAVELWTMAGAPHIPALSSSFASDIVDFLYAHPKR